VVPPPGHRGKRQLTITLALETLNQGLHTCSLDGWMPGRNRLFQWGKDKPNSSALPPSCLLGCGQTRMLAVIFLSRGVRWTGGRVDRVWTLEDLLAASTLGKLPLISHFNFLICKMGLITYLFIELVIRTKSENVYKTLIGA
jgi:hypothetical protein